MNRSWISMAILTLLAGCSGSGPDGQTAPETVITYFEGGTVLIGDGTDPIPGAALVVADGVVTAVGPMEEVEHPAGSERYDFTDHTIMPFLHNAHGHVGYVRGLDFSQGNYNRETIMEDLERYAYWGVGTVASLGLDISDTAFQIREEQRSGPVGSARLLTAGRGITTRNGFPAVGVPAVEGVPYQVANEQEARAAVRELVGQGVDFVKIWVDDNRRRTGQAYRFGQMAYDYASSPKLSPDLYRAIIDEASMSGTPVVAHVRYLADAKGLVDAGIAGLVHSIRDNPVDDALIQAMLANDVFYVPTLSNHQAQFIYADQPAWLREPGTRESVAPATIARLTSPAYIAEKRADLNLDLYRSEFDTAMQNVKTLYDAGVRIGLGTDSGGEFYRLRGIFEHRELELMVEAGIPASDVIRIGTQATAQILGVEDSGTLEPGKRGDFLIVSGNPAVDITKSRDIAEVFMLGESLDRATMSARFQGFDRGQ
jgi:imidazolonepropionase-like amidohydrolase